MTGARRRAIPVAPVGEAITLATLMRLCALSLSILLAGCAGETSAGVLDGPVVTPRPGDAAARPDGNSSPDQAVPIASDATAAIGRSDAGVDGRDGGDAAADARADGAASPSAGCGKPAVGTSRYERRMVSIRGVAREYFLWVPRTYDPRRPYPVIFRWHGSGGNGTSGGLEIEAAAAEDAVIVSPSGLGGQWSLDPNGPDVALFDTLLARLGGELCLDGKRVFSYGFSLGGFFTNLLACVRSSVVRGAAPVEGAPAGSNCGGRVAAWIVHGTPDTAVRVASGIAARDRYRQLNGCSATATPDPPAPCVRYQGCAAGYPVVWCQTDSPHDPQGRFSAPGAWSFFRSLP
jgi:polyhydroxybutyrate depolymerase